MDARSGAGSRRMGAPSRSANDAGSQARGRRGGGSAGRSGRGGQRSDGNRSSRPAARPVPAGRRPAPEPEPQVSELVLPDAITVHDLANLMKRSPIDLIKELMNAGIMANINQVIDRDTATIVAEDMGFTVVEPEAPVVEEVEEEAPTTVTVVQQREYAEDELSQLESRPPVVTILGHVDHGKTSLLDVIRATNVQAGEAGGITQHIGAYQVDVGGKRITFLDTPGHEAFTAMRARGANVTDIAVLVVAADDGVQPQTREAINHARAAHVPIIVAINKVDLPSANVDNAMNQLADLGLVPEDWGGETICVPVSARTRLNIDTLLDNILVVAELSNLRANPQRTPSGHVLESRLDRGQGATATLLVREGTLSVGDTVLAGTAYGRIRAMYDFQGNPTDKVTPSTPVMVTGLREVPTAGEGFEVVESERKAREVVEERLQAARNQTVRPAGALTLEEVYAQAQAGAVQSLNLVLKVDVQGSIEPIRSSLEQLEVGDLKVDFIHTGVGTITESDVMLAVASQAIIVGFNVTVDGAAERQAEADGVQIRTYNIIYRLIEDLQKALEGMLAPEFEEKLQGRATVRQVFSIPRVGVIAGCRVIEGRAVRNAKARVMRDGRMIHEGQVNSLKRFTDDVRDVATGYECGVGIADAKDLQPEDIIEFYTMEIKQ